ncbi:hypothetical protein, partial [Klebsiella pneumoniae]|uniref:hypothetical protein n=1 Tax=Klebsiella pneumoniae TaxID=573 RepID=UPI0012B83852
GQQLGIDILFGIRRQTLFHLLDRHNRHVSRCRARQTLLFPLLLPDGNVFPARYELIFLAAGVILFSLFVGVIALPILLRHIE